MKDTTKASHKCTSHKFLCALVLLCTCAFVQAKVLPKTAELIPPETVLLVDVDNFNQLKTQFEKTNLYKLYKDPAMAAFIEDVKAKWREKIQKLDDNGIVKTIVNADVLPQGRVAVALVLNEQIKDSNDPPVLFITQWGENIAKIKEAIDKMVKENIELGGHQRSENYRGVGIKIMLDEESSTYADYTATIKAIGPYHDIDFYVNIKQIIKTILAEDTTGEAQPTIANLGLDNVASLGGSLGLGRRPGSSSCGKAFLKINGAKKGICKMLDIESAVLKAPRFIPASAYSATFLNLDIKKAYNELGNILNSFSPQAAAWMYTPLPTSSSPDEPGLKIKDDIIDHLGSQIAITQSINKPFFSSSMPTESLVAVAVVNRRALEKSLSLLHSKVIAPNNPDARRELLGYTIYQLSLPPLPFLTSGMTPMQGPVEPSAPQMPKLAFTITETHLIFGAESTVEQAIRTLSSTGAVSVGSAEWFTSAKSAVPSVVGLACLEDNAASSELFWWMLKESGKDKASTIPAGTASFRFSSMEIGKLVNFNLLPEFDAVRKYFGLSAFYGISRPDGFFFEFRDINPSSID